MAHHFFFLQGTLLENRVKEDLILVGRALVHLLAREPVEARRRSNSLFAVCDNAAPAARPDGPAASTELPVEDSLGAAEVKVEADAILVGGGAVDGRPRVTQVL